MNTHEVAAPVGRHAWRAIVLVAGRSAFLDRLDSKEDAVSDVAGGMGLLELVPWKRLDPGSVRPCAIPQAPRDILKLEALHAQRGEFSFSLGYIKRGGEKGRHGVREGGRKGTQERGPGGMT